MRYLIFLGIAFAAITCIAFTGYNIAALATCDNIAALNNPVCVNTWIVTTVTGSTNTIVDAYILVLPIAMVLRLQLSRQRKFGVIVVFAIGSLYVQEQQPVPILSPVVRGGKADGATNIEP